MPPNVAKLLSLSPMYKAAIIGAGASGCFCAVEMKRRHPDWDIVVLESPRRCKSSPSPAAVAAISPTASMRSAACAKSILAANS